MIHRNLFLSGVVSRGVESYTYTDPNTYAILTELTAQIQKVSAQLAAASPSRGGLEMRKRAPQVVNNQ
jgi:hypothetical protein